MDKGLSPLEAVQSTFGLEDALDNLASVVREAVDMDAVYRSLGLSGCCAQASLFRMGG
jgi:hypothetical protein